jgi:hypothetical protein
MAFPSDDFAQSERPWPKRLADDSKSLKFKSGAQIIAKQVRDLFRGHCILARVDVNGFAI